MPSHFNKPNRNSPGGGGGGGGLTKPKSGSPPSGKLTFRTAKWPSVPGKTGPNRNTTGVNKIKQHPVDKGL